MVTARKSSYHRWICALSAAATADDEDEDEDEDGGSGRMVLPGKMGGIV